MASSRANNTNTSNAAAFMLQPLPRLSRIEDARAQSGLCRTRQRPCRHALGRCAAAVRPHWGAGGYAKTRVVPSCTSESARVPDSPDTLVQSWVKSRSISSTVDLSRRFISVLFLSNHCQRAAFAEKILAKVADKYAISRRLLILSAGLYSKPGDLLPWHLVSAARDRDVDLSDERPCASFEITDLDYYDFVIVVDQNVRDKLMSMAEASAHTSGGHLYQWERKIRLLCQFDGLISRSSFSAQTIDVPDFDSGGGFSNSMDAISDGCEQIIRSLVAAGL